MTDEPLGAVKVFYSYAHEDKILCVELEKHLGILKRQGQITGWHDRDISAGTEWEREIDTHLNVASIILLLVSPDFIHSEYCYSIEMRRALERHHAGEAIVIPVLIRPVDWEDAPFSKLQFLPTDRKPITSWSNRDEAFLDVAKGIRKAVRKIKEEWLDENNPQTKINSKSAPSGHVSERYREGLEVYERAILLNPNNVEAYIGKGNVLCNLKHYTEASGAYHQAILLDPNNVEAYLLRGKALYTGALYERALVVYEQAIRLDPNNVESYNGKSSTLSALGRYTEALITCDQAISLDPFDARAYNNKGVALRKLERYEKALAVFEQAIRLDPSFAHAYIGKGNALYKLNRYGEALIAFEQAILMDPNLPVAYNNTRL